MNAVLKNHSKVEISYWGASLDFLAQPNFLLRDHKNIIPLDRIQLGIIIAPARAVQLPKFERGRGGGRGGLGGERGGRGRGRGRGGREALQHFILPHFRSGKEGDKEWVPVTKLGRLEFEIIDSLLFNLKDEVLKIMPAFVAIGDHNGHVGLGVKCSKEVATAIRGAIVAAKLSVIPVRRGYWGNKIGQPHTVPCKESSFNKKRMLLVTGKCGSVLVRLIPAPRGTGIVSAPVPKKLLQMAGVEDCYTSAVGQTATLGNFAKENALEKTPYQRYWEFLAQTPVRS
uniref:Small ribosomal subunit protein uS5 n=1 Tax=Parascaris equorum TaxID=6256 RepID=A0A914RYA8_PAREQ